MKKILAIAVLMIMSQTLVFAQKEKAVKEADVPIRFVKDFQNQAPEAQNVAWSMTTDSVEYVATFMTNEGDKQSIRFSNKGTETRYYVESQFYPRSIRDSVEHLYPKHKIKEVYIRNLKRKMTYQCEIYRPKGFLFWKKETERKLLSFETDGKMIETVELQ